ncbi:PAS domain-containing protein [Pseudoruegeria sp. SK021]|uniref:PAS domain-containing protein n=1 Tax=Pseudoruegeria sp. SK021 TaxID=1933035 RepID=UPI000A26049E|nr:PAS domain-containing protein [Pseudoruegeria sp. SK021]OSP55043.1 histidine kinase [Pseudoruegeria sp. SK021]
MEMTQSGISWGIQKDESMAQTFHHIRLPLCVTDPNLPDNPIVYVNKAFCDLTGYASAEVIGKNCRFLQGPNTSTTSVAAVRDIIARQAVDTVEILNYRKDGSEFLNALQIGPILDDDGKLAFFFGSQLDVSSKREDERRMRALAEEELLHRLRNIVNVMSAIIRMTARGETDLAQFSQTLKGRLEALSEAHFKTITHLHDGRPLFGDLAAMILNAYAPLRAQQFELSGPDYAIPSALVSVIALTLHELATNAVKHGALGTEDGKVVLQWAITDSPPASGLEFLWTEQNGPAVVRSDRVSGSAIVNNLVAASGGTITFDWAPQGLIVTGRFPALA